MNTPVEPLVYTVKDAKRLLSISHTTLYRAINAGDLEVRKIGARTLITAASIKRLADAGSELDAA